MDFSLQQIIIGCAILPFLLVPLILLYLKAAAYLMGKVQLFEDITRHLAKQNVGLRAALQAIIPTFLVFIFLAGSERFSEWVWSINKTPFWLGIAFARYLIPVVMLYPLISAIIYWKIKPDSNSENKSGAEYNRKA